MDLRPATELKEIVKKLYGWSCFHAQWKVNFNSYALKTTDGIVLIDPLKPEATVLKELEGLGEFSGIFLTNAQHDRDADWFRKHYEIQIYAHEKAKADCDTSIDVLVMDGETLPGSVKAIHLPGSSASETAFYTKVSGGIMMMGDILSNSGGRGLTLLPEPYIEDRKQALKSLPKLLQHRFTTITFAHGDPLVKNAEKQIENFLKKPKKDIA
jgi:glyoxylase-like metal-dependent hydrolase (beta-lactamase superfamily II)